jgi:hypothetical protein
MIQFKDFDNLKDLNLFRNELRGILLNVETLLYNPQSYIITYRLWYKTDI